MEPVKLTPILLPWETSSAQLARATVTVLGLEAPTCPCPLKLEDFFVKTNLLL